MIKHMKYLWYVVRHKWYVFVECCKMGIPIAGLLHDMSKMLPSEWIAYVRYFYGGPYPSIYDFHGDERNYALSLVTKESVKENFDFAWLLHQHKNPHHWQFWLLREDNGEIKALFIPVKYTKEMLADWRGASCAIKGHDDTKNWYLANKNKMVLHPETRAWIERQLGVSPCENLI